jgi:hypothetical protein
MEYRGIEYSVVQGIERGVWKWSVNLDKSNIKSGQADSKPAALTAVERTIDKALTPKRRRLVLPTSK